MGRRSKNKSRVERAGNRPSRPELPEKGLADQGGPFSAPLAGARRFRGWRAWLLRLSLCFLSPLLFVGLLEAGLRVAGYGYPTGFFLGPDSSGNYTTNDRFGWRFFPRTLARTPQPCILAAKPPGTIRIFVLGDSAAMGTPDPAFSFGRILEVMLREEYPGQKFEVVNAAMTAINSHVTAEIARDCAAHQPDLFVVYMGNNEVIGPFGPGTVFQRWSPNPWMIHANLWVRSMRFGQLLSNAAGWFRHGETSPGHWGGMEMFLKNPVPADDPRLAAVYDNFRTNLRAICRTARGASAGVVLSTMAVNLRDSPPFASQHRKDLSAEELAQWDSIYKSGCGLEAQGSPQAAIDKYEQAAKIDDRFAELQFRLARCLVAAGRTDDAREHYELARDLDVLRFRTDRRLNAVIREVGEEQATSGVRLADAEKAIGQAGDPPHSDSELFYEHVHFTFAGNYQLARTIFEQVRQALPQLAAGGTPGQMPSPERVTALLALSPWDEYDLIDAMVDMTRPRPFADQLEHDRRMASAIRHRDELQRLASTPEAQQAACKTYEAAIARSPDDWELRLHFGKQLAMHFGKPDAAVEQLAMVAERVPWFPAAHHSLGSALADEGKTDEAIAHYRKALEIDPDLWQVHNDLGHVLEARGKTDEAIAEYRKALEIAPSNSEARINLGLALEAQGNADEAIAEYEKGLKVNPGLVAAHGNIACILAGRGQVDEAIRRFRKAVEIQPDYVDGHFNLGMLLAKQGKTDEAIKEYATALKFNPKLAEAHVKLGTILGGLGQNDEAAEHFRKALAIKPDYADAHKNLGVVLFRQRQFDAAAAEYHKVIESNPGDADAYNALGMVYVDQRQFGEAVADFQKAVSLQPDNNAFRENLTHAQSERSRAGSTPAVPSPSGKGPG